MTKKSSTSFKKGICPNPNGRPKGALSKINKLRLKFEIEAEKDSAVAYAKIKEGVEAGQGWAHAIFWKDILPKRKDRNFAPIDLEKERLKAVLEGLRYFDFLTHEELMDEIRSLTSIKLAEKIVEIEEMESTQDKMSLIEKINLLIGKKSGSSIN